MIVTKELIQHTGSEEASALHERLVEAGGLSSKLFENVLIPVDPQTESRCLIATASDIAAKFHSRMVVVNAVPHDPTGVRDETDIRARRAELDRIAEKLRVAGASYVQTILAEGNPAGHIEQAVQQFDVSLILLCEQKDSAHAYAWFGTLTQRLARRVRVPMMVVKPDGHTTLKPVLCVVDFTEASRKALKYSISLARDLGATLTVLHVVPEPLPFPLVEGPIWQIGRSPLSAARTSDWSRQSADSPVSSDMESSRHQSFTRRELEGFLSLFDFSGLKYDVVVSSGSPALETLTAAKERKVGVIVTGSDQRSGFVHYMSQTTAETLAETADVPVLIFRGSGERSSVQSARPTAGRSLPIN